MKKPFNQQNVCQNLNKKFSNQAHIQKKTKKSSNADINLSSMIVTIIIIENNKLNESETNEKNLG